VSSSGASAVSISTVQQNSQVYTLLIIRRVVIVVRSGSSY